MTQPSLLITGSSGFVGRHFVSALDFTKYGTVYSLSRRPTVAAPPLPPNLAVIAADLCAPERYCALLGTGTTVVHLAAATGKATPADHRRVNVEGTRALLAACAQAGVRRFLHVSSIAVKFPEKKYYPYARCKEEGEALVRASGLPFTILRPAIIVGRESPVLAGLKRLAALPVMPVFGSGQARVQPLHVGDLVRAMLLILAEGRFQGETLELGGPQALAVEDFMKRIRGCLGSGRARALHIPLPPLIALLGMAEKALGPLLPLSAGQLYSFRYDGLAEKNTLSERLVGSFLGIDAMLKESLSNG
jgi:NADH dehydrogenase